MNNGIQTSFGPITVDGIRQSDFNAAKFTAQVRQVVTTTYPSMRVGNSKTSMLFGLEQFDIPAGETYNSTRVTWIPVPAGTTVEQVTERLAALEQKRIYRAISYNLMDVLTDEQLSALANKITTIDVLEAKCRVRATNGDELPGAPLYSQNFFANTLKADEDFRTEAQRNTNVVREEEVVTQGDALATTAAENGLVM